MAGFLDWLQGIGSAFGLGYNIFSNERNFYAQQRQLAVENERYLENRDYQRTLQQKVFEREDTAIQRASLDAQKAGFSPLTVAGNGSASGALVGSSYQAPANGQASFSPIDTLALVRGLQEMSIAEDANERAERATDADIAFKQAQLDNETECMGNKTYCSDWQPLHESHSHDNATHRNDSDSQTKNRPVVHYQRKTTHLCRFPAYQAQHVLEDRNPLELDKDSGGGDPGSNKCLA